MWRSLTERQSAKCFFCFRSFVCEYFLLLCPGMGAKYCNWRVCMSLCLSVCLFVCQLTYLNNHTTKFHEMFCTCYRGSVLLWRQCDTLCTSGSANDVTFSYNGANIGQHQRRHLCLVKLARWRSLPSPTAAGYLLTPFVCVISKTAAACDVAWTLTRHYVRRSKTAHKTSDIGRRRWTLTFRRVVRALDSQLMSGEIPTRESVDYTEVPLD